ncbi:NAD-dependent epimerase/dehydratase family protein [Vreelandella rituensis]|uniref:NAD-dependent epimerase/dehydratase family protein n=1 Tax=Vreelandella rituensis TaxID=2282306 RepID=A0A368U8R3_9GAMM|nr:NAD-dependent epimerase/dehydratase family protein [Halomonas rituensis]RCV92502.1 NAD-dependent epimerase/dehydratase family protein [Halomonas rituensis]
MSKASKRVLVTGGAGFIGSHSVEQLLASGYNVCVLDNLSTGKLTNLPHHDGLTFIKGDVCDLQAVKDAMQGASYCLHLAAQVSVVRSVEDPSSSAQQNILGCINVMQAAHEAGVNKLVYASSAAVYGNPRHLPIAETSTVCPLSPYGLEKWVDEQYAALFHTLYGLPSLGLRYFNVFGPRQDPKSPYAGVISKFFDCLIRKTSPTVFGDGRQTRDFIFVKDVARANIAALTSSHQGVCNVATGNRVDLLALLSLLHGVTGNYLPAVHLPSRDEDIRDSQGDTQRSRAWLDIQPQWTLNEGLKALYTATSETHAA